MITKLVKTKYIVTDGNRIDGKFFLNKDALLSLKMKENEDKCLPLSELAFVFNPPVFKRQFCQNTPKAVPYFQSSDVSSASELSSVFINKNQAKKINVIVKENQILVTGFGTIGNVRLVSKLQDGVAYANNTCRIEVNPTEYYGFIYAFISSKYGKSQLNKNASGSVVRYIEAPGIKRILIPIFPKEKQLQIHNLIVESADLRVEANKLLNDAVNYFNQKYSPQKIENTKVFSKRLSNLNFSWAAYNNNIESDKIINVFKGEKTSIKNIAENIFVPPMFKHIYLNKNNGNPFLTGSELTQQNPKFYRYLSPRGVKNITDYKVHKGTLLLYKSGTTDGGILGNVFIVDELLDGACLSDHVIRINLEDIQMSYWVFAFLKSDAGAHLLKRLATGTMIPFITPERISELEIPKPDDNFDLIANYISEYITKKTMSNIKENQAIQLVENEIEQWQN